MLSKLILFAILSGITVFIGGLLARYFNHHVKESPVKFEIIHFLISIGAGIMLSAIALVLVPAGMQELEVLPLAIAFSLGAIVFMYTDNLLAKSGSQTSTLLAMLMDFIPESIALGALFSTDQDSAILLAIFIGLQNLPEAFNSYRDLVRSGIKSQNALIIFFILSFLGLAGALAGHFFLRDQPFITASMMTFAAGGILYLLIQDIIPEIKLENNSKISLGATLGFLIGMIGEQLV